MSRDARKRIYEAIQKRIQEVGKEPVSEIGFVGDEEREIARLYERVGDYDDALRWHVRCVERQVKYGQVIQALAYIEFSLVKYPDSLELRKLQRDLKAMIGDG